MDDLTRLGLVDDADITIDKAALTVALADHPNVDGSPYIDLLKTLARRLDLGGLGATDAYAQADALSHGWAVSSASSETEIPANQRCGSM